MLVRWQGEASVIELTPPPNGGIGGHLNGMLGMAQEAAEQVQALSCLAHALSRGAPRETVAWCVTVGTGLLAQHIGPCEAHSRVGATVACFPASKKRRSTLLPFGMMALPLGMGRAGTTYSKPRPVTLQTSVR